MFTDSKITEIINTFEAEVKALVKDEALSKELEVSIDKMKRSLQTIEKDGERHKLQRILCKYGYRMKNKVEFKIFNKAFSIHSMSTLSSSNMLDIAEEIFNGKAVYEVIPKLRRLYLDIEGAIDANQVLSTIENFIRYLNHSYRLGPGSIYYIATRNDQSHHKGLSSHVIFNIVCDYQFQRYLIRDFIMKTGCTIIDPLPYARCQLLRIPYSMNPTRKYTDIPRVFSDGTRKPNEFKFISKLFKDYKLPPVRCQDFHYIWLSTYPSTYNKAIPYFCSEWSDCVSIERIDDNKIAEMYYSADEYFDEKYTFTDDQDTDSSHEASTMKAQSTSNVHNEASSSLSSMDLPLGLKIALISDSPRLSKFEYYYRMHWKHEQSY